MHTCCGTRAPPSEAKPSKIIGTQHRKSVITIKVIRFAIEVSDSTLDFRTACVVRFATKNIHRYDKNIKRNDTKFNTRNTNTEYSQPPTWSGVI